MRAVVMAFEGVDFPSQRGLCSARAWLLVRCFARRGRQPAAGQGALSCLLPRRAGYEARFCCPLLLSASRLGVAQLSGDLGLARLRAQDFVTS